MFGVVGGSIPPLRREPRPRVSPRLMDIAAIRIQAAGRGLLGRLRSRDAQYESLRKLVSSMGYYLEWFKTDLQPKCTIRHRGSSCHCWWWHGPNDMRVDPFGPACVECDDSPTRKRGFLEVSKAAVFKQKLCTNSKCRREGNGVFCAFAHDPKQLIPPLPANEVFGTRVAFEGHVLAAYCRNAGLGDPIEYEMRRSARVEMERAREEARVQSVNEETENLAISLSLDGVLPGGGAALRDAEDFVWSKFDGFVVNEDTSCVICLDEPRTFASVGCGHRHFCESCARVMTECAMCRTPVPVVDGVRQVLRIHL